MKLLTTLIALFICLTTSLFAQEQYKRFDTITEHSTPKTQCIIESLCVTGKCKLNTITLLSANNSKQLISIKRFGLYYELPNTVENIFTFRDINFDGRLDFTLLENQGAYGNSTYFYFIQNNQGEFIRNKEFELLSEPEFLTDKKLIKSTYLPSLREEPIVTYYRVINNKLDPIKKAP